MLWNLVRVFVAVCLSLVMGAGGYRKKAVTKDGAAAGVVVGLCCGVAGGYRGLILLGAFFISSTALTRYRTKEKMRIEHGHKKGGQRTAVQVFSNAVGGCLCCLASYVASTAFSSSVWLVDELAVDFGAFFWPSFWVCGLLAHFSCTNGDTWASEVGTVMAQGKPRLLLGVSQSGGRLLVWQQVPTGTNGGMSLAGTLASVLGGLFIGICFAVTSAIVCVPGGSSAASFVTLCLLGAIYGFVGSLVDSILGGLFQYSGWDESIVKVVNEPTAASRHVTGLAVMDNHQVNLLSSLLMAAIGPAIALAIV